jgi:hypothetical protein
MTHALKNPWFARAVLPELRQKVRQALSGGK